VADYSEFPTTPTAWQEVTPLEIEDAPPPQRRTVDLVALIPGLVFVVLAITVMAGANLPFFFEDGGLVWVALIGGGIALLVSELRKARRRKP
jgi:hypothetical protein